MDRDKALDKIRKCLALAGSSNPHAAATAMRQAQKLMAEFDITDDDVQLTDVGEDSVRASYTTLTRWESNLALLIAEAFGCEQFTRLERWIGPRGRKISERHYCFVGVGAAPQIATYAFEVLSRQCAADRLRHIASLHKNCLPATRTARGDAFARGWVRGVSALVQKHAGGARHHQLLQQFMQRNHPELREVTVRDRLGKKRGLSLNDLAQGLQVGRNAQLSHALHGQGAGQQIRIGLQQDA